MRTRGREVRQIVQVLKVKCKKGEAEEAKMRSEEGKESELLRWAGFLRSRR